MSFDLRDQLQELFEAHDLATTLHEEWVLPGGEFPGIRGRFRDSRRAGSEYFVSLDIGLAIDLERVMLESFVGTGGTEAEAQLSAWRGFCQGSLYVFLATFWDTIEGDQVAVEYWRIAGKRWRAVIGNFVRRMGDGAAGGSTEGSRAEIAIPPSLFSTLEALILKSNPEHDRHWVRIFYGNRASPNVVSPNVARHKVRGFYGSGDGVSEPAIEALWDNQDWPEARNALREMDWPERETYYSVRNFLTLSLES